MATPRIIYQDNCLLVLDKPAGLVVDKSNTSKEKALEDILKEDYKIELFRGGIVHRLDKDTSGILLVAKTQKSLENLQNQFQERTVKKEYVALVHGEVLQPGVVEGSIGRNPGNREKFTVLEEGKEAETEYQPISNSQFSILNLQSIFNNFNKIQMRKLERMLYNQFTLLKCLPKTGRTHQIRVHLKYINHPIVSDEKYAGRKMYRLDKRWCPRMFLHAQKIGFKHPETGDWMELESNLPEDLKKALRNLSQKLKSQKLKVW
ncbi:RluA family pseudouridine synthase [Candidatus Daviesbacteria bacterium]|nr:RluA family pseudouridine synthase [Candidatus Daviesbacteria bacterium]